MADFTNMNFVSKDTNFCLLNGAPISNANYLLPVPGPLSQRVSIAALLGPGGDALCNALRNDPRAPANASCETEFYSSLVRDPTTNQNEPNPRASSLSVFDQYLSAYGVQSVSACGSTNQPVDRVFTLNQFNYDSAHTFLLHRAVGYSAGLIDHFFRGRIKITEPDEGVFGVIDHSAIARHEFTKIKLKARNATKPLATPTGQVTQIVGPGMLRAVARYTVNPCYQDNLSGEINILNVIWAGCPMAVYLSGEKGISVSAPRPIGGLSDTEEVPFTFDFSADPIPINVRDLILQVVFTEGPLGSEQDAIAVGTVNLSEPTYVSHLNSMDYFDLNGELHTPAEIRSNDSLRSQLDFDGDGDVDQNDIDIDPEPMIDVRLQIDEHVLAGPTTLQPKNYFRIAVLADSIDRQPFGFPLLFTYLTEDPHFPGGIPSASLTTIRQLQNQFERDPARASAIGKVRGVHYWYMRFVIKSHGDENATVGDFMALPDLPDPGPTPIAINFE